MTLVDGVVGAAAIAALATCAVMVGRAVHPGVGHTSASAGAALLIVASSPAAPGRQRTDVLAMLGDARPGRILRRRWAAGSRVARRLELAGEPAPSHVAGRVVAGAAAGAVLCVGVASVAPPMGLLAPLER